MELTVGTFNIQHGIDYPRVLETGETRVDLQPVADAILEMRPDVLGLNEIYGAHPDMGNQAAELGYLTGLGATFAKAISIHGGDYGNALLSRFPVRTIRCIPIGVPKAERQYHGYYEDRVLLHAKLDVEGQTVSVLCCHFGLNPDEMEQAVEAVRREQEGIRHPLIFMGDLNLCPGSEPYRMLTAFLTDASLICDKPPLTFPSHVPDCQIDHIFVNSACTVQRVWVPEILYSDHRPILARISFSSCNSGENVV